MTEPAQMTEAAQAPNADLAARFVALSLLEEVLQRGQSLDITLERHEGFRSLPSRDRGFCRMLTATTLRRLGQVDDLIKRTEERPDTSRPPLLQNILRLGTAQIVFMDVPDHAAVDTSVRLTESYGYERQKGFVNGMLRNIIRTQQEIVKRQDPARLNTPEWMLRGWIEDYELRTAAEIAMANLSEAPLDITIKSEEERNYWASNLQASQLATGTLRRIGLGGAVYEFEGFEEGAWWVQDAAAAIPAKLFGDVNGQHVIDLCAAPGGKTAQLLAQGAHVTAIDRSAQRLKRLRENLERLKLNANVDVQVSDASAWRPSKPAERILLDAPCTATGTIRRHPDILHLKTANDMKSLMTLQAAILQNAFDMLMPGGILVYCTCSLQKAEGEHQVERLLRENQKAARVPIGREEIGKLDDLLTEDGDVRILPFHLASQGGMDGFYIARLTKLEG